MGEGSRASKHNSRGPHVYSYEEVRFRLCYCAWSAQVLGCDDDAVLVDAGTLTVTPAAVAPDDGLGYGYGYI